MSLIKNLFFPVLIMISTISLAQPIPTPKEHFGFNIGDNYQLANYTKTEAYFKKLDQASDRAKLTSIGKTEEGKDVAILIGVESDQDDSQENRQARAEKPAENRDIDFKAERP